MEDPSLCQSPLMRLPKSTTIVAAGQAVKKAPLLLRFRLVSFPLRLMDGWMDGRTDGRVT
jgi:hypothetical protein